MQRTTLPALALASILGSASSAFAQGGDLGGVTMRVLDDVSDIDAVVLDIGDDRGEAEDGAADEGPDAERDTGAAGEAARERGSLDDIEDAEDEEHGEGELEDNDVLPTPDEAAEEPVAE
jgi:hypothetical protein